jgi:hypothetical protein
MATAPLPPTASKESNAQIGISVGFIVALVALAIIVARLMRRVRPPNLAPAALQRPYIYETQQHKGIKRSMLDSIPVVKYHEGLNQSTNHSNSPRTGFPAKYMYPIPNVLPPVEEKEEENQSSDSLNKLSSTSKIELKQDKQIQISHYEPAGCSICTEDFQETDIVRILPCKHIYHRRCIDPWLLDFTGTCPLW